MSDQEKHNGELVISLFSERGVICSVHMNRENIVFESPRTCRSSNGYMSTVSFPVLSWFNRGSVCVVQIWEFYA